MPRHKKNYSRPKGKKFNNHSKKIHKKGTKNTDQNDPRKNLKFIKRSKEAEEQQRRQKIIEDKYRLQSRPTKIADQSEEDASELEEEQNPFEELLSTFESAKDGADHDNRKSAVIDSSSDEENEEESEMESDEDAEGNDEEELGSEEEDVDMEGQDEEGEEEDIGEEMGEEEEDELPSDGEDNVYEDGERVEEEEEAIEDGTEDPEIVAQSNTNTDPFSIHLDNELSQQHIDNLLAKPPVTRKSLLNWKELGNLQVEISRSKLDSNSSESKDSKKKTVLLDDDNYASEGTEPVLVNVKKDGIATLQIKPKIQQNIAIANNTADDSPLTPLQSEIFSIANNYQDLFYPNRNISNGEDIRLVYCLHALNHMTKTRSKIIHHNTKLTAMANEKKSTAIIPDAYRDQGLVRPKILIVVPFRNSALLVVNTLVALLFGEKAETAKTNGNVMHYSRFLEEFTGDSIYFPKTNPKPEDYEKTFAGNTDDTFRIGISLTKKCMKLYSEFYSSDILIASPLGLRMIVGAPGDAERDYDFLTSIEILVLDQAELFLAQNWDHLLHVLDHMHLQPQSVRNTDFSRVRPWCLNGLSKFYRQTLLFTSHELPEFRSLFNNKCSNYRGKIRVVNPVIGGSIRNVIVQIPQVFHKIDVTSLDTSFDSRFKYFTEEILPQFKSPSMAHCMIYVPSYFDYVRLRNYMKTETINFVQICEYTKDAKIARARDMFFHSAAHFLLYSERAHFFRRTRIKGIRHLIMYQPPNWPHLYAELVNLMQETNQNSRDGLDTSMSVTVLYSKYDMLQVSSITGTGRASKMLLSGKTTHMFMTGQ